MSVETDISLFLRNARNRVSPRDVGLPAVGRRHVPGLRREEVAELANISREYYAKIERGRLQNVSEDILLAIAEALLFTAEETRYLLDMFKRQKGRLTTDQVADAEIPAALLRFLEENPGTPVLVRNICLDILAGTEAGKYLYSEVMASAVAEANTARFIFLDPAAHEFFIDWELAARGVVATMRSYTGQFPQHRRLREIIGELKGASSQFSRWWELFSVAHHREGNKRINHPQLGRLDLIYQGFNLAECPTCTVYAVSSKAGSESEHKLARLRQAYR